MLKRIFLSSILLASFETGFAQRYLKPVFDSVQVNSDIQFGFNYSYKGDSTKLYLDLYVPYGDTLNIKRPIVILAHGGSFIQGSRKAADISVLCKRLANYGYITASIDYRLGADILSGKTLEQEYQQSVWRATQDARAAIRFFNKSIQTGNPYKIDENNIYTGGISAGGVMGLHLAFLDLPVEIESTMIDTTIAGGIEGESGNPGYSWRVKGVVSLSGGMGSVNWMNNNKNVSLCMMHGDADATVPYKTAYIKFFGADVTIVQGSFSIDSASHLMGVDSKFFTFNGAGHIPFSGTTTAQQIYMDTTVDFVARYLYRHVTGLTPNGISEANKIPISYTIYPNPVSSILHLTFNNELSRTFELVDLTGRFVLSINSSEQNIDLITEELQKGIYLLRITENNHITSQKIIVH